MELQQMSHVLFFAIVAIFLRGISATVPLEVTSVCQSIQFSARKALTKSNCNVASKPWTVPRGGESSEVVDTEVESSIPLEKELNQQEETIETKQEDIATSAEDKDPLIFAASKPGDGSESDPDGLPTRFLKMQKGNRDKAKAAFDTTVQWRNDLEINSILSRPHPKYDICKRVFPAYIPGRDVSNNVIVIQRVGMIDFKLGKHNNITGDDLLMNYVYLVEYCWNILEPGPPDGVMTTVMDLKNVHFSTFRDKEIRQFLKKFVKTMSDHYPSRSFKTLIINAPSWVNMAYKLVKPLLRESTRQKITVMNGGANQDKSLIELLGKNSVPREILSQPELIDELDGGEDYQSIEDEMREFVSRLFK